MSHWRQLLHVTETCVHSLEKAVNADKSRQALKSYWVMTSVNGPGSGPRVDAHHTRAEPGCPQSQN